ncbi:GIY-YIG nuclease family protein [Candidatus Daviesbacteria bacterium]|nr:GIY-YIG nuclease family protein [Candidatus Daviesbacteria bacterium]
MWYVYILQCVDGSLYTGYSNDLRQRFEDHKNGTGGHYTRSHKPSKLIYKEKLATKGQALKREYEIKKWSREKKIKILKLNVAI